jgi:RecB family endonuclease NucS
MPANEGGERDAEPSAGRLGEDMDEEDEMRKALRDNLEQLEQGLKFVQEERYVKFGATEFGYIDIVAQDKAGMTVVIELKKGDADYHAVSQVASYMGAFQEEGTAVRGMLIAYGFSHRALAAARMVNDLELHRYGHLFRFEKIPQPSGS